MINRNIKKPKQLENLKINDLKPKQAKDIIIQMINLLVPIKRVRHASRPKKKSESEKNQCEYKGDFPDGYRQCLSTSKRPQENIQEEARRVSIYQYRCYWHSIADRVGKCCIPTGTTLQNIIDFLKDEKKLAIKELQQFKDANVFCENNVKENQFLCEKHYKQLQPAIKEWISHYKGSCEAMNKYWDGEWRTTASNLSKFAERKLNGLDCKNAKKKVELINNCLKDRKRADKETRNKWCWLKSCTQHDYEKERLGWLKESAGNKRNDICKAEAPQTRSSINN